MDELKLAVLKAEVSEDCRVLRQSASEPVALCPVQV
jgi:hypothetical protein